MTHSIFTPVRQFIESMIISSELSYFNNLASLYFLISRSTAYFARAIIQDPILREGRGIGLGISEIESEHVSGR